MSQFIRRVSESLLQQPDLLVFRQKILILVLSHVLLDPLGSTISVGGVTACPVSCLLAEVLGPGGRDLGCIGELGLDVVLAARKAWHTCGALLLPDVLEEADSLVIFLGVLFLDADESALGLSLTLLELGDSLIHILLEAAQVSASLVKLVLLPGHAEALEACLLQLLAHLDQTLALLILVLSEQLLPQPLGADRLRPSLVQLLFAIVQLAAHRVELLL